MIVKWYMNILEPCVVCADGVRCVAGWRDVTGSCALSVVGKPSDGFLKSRFTTPKSHFTVAKVPVYIP